MPVTEALPEDCHTIIRTVAAYWSAIHPAPGVLPAREDFDPLDLPAAVWPHLVLSEILDPDFDVKYRLVGTAVVKLDGVDRTGMTFSEYPPRRDRRETVADYRLAIDGRAVSFRRIPLFDRERGYRLTLERAHFPLAANGRDVDMILTALVKLDRPRAPSA